MSCTLGFAISAADCATILKKRSGESSAAVTALRRRTIDQKLGNEDQKGESKQGTSYPDHVWDSVENTFLKEIGRGGIHGDQTSHQHLTLARPVYPKLNRRPPSAHKNAIPFMQGCSRIELECCSRLRCAAARLELREATLGEPAPAGSFVRIWQAAVSDFPAAPQKRLNCGQSLTTSATRDRKRAWRRLRCAGSVPDTVGISGWTVRTPPNPQRTTARRIRGIGQRTLHCTHGPILVSEIKCVT